jgi:fatty acid desaturase
MHQAISSRSVAARGIFRYHADVRSIVFVASYGILATTGWLFTPRSPWLVALWVAATCVSSWIVGVVTHNTIHSPVFRHRALNRAFQVWLSLSYGWPVSEYGPGHNLSHHKHTQKGKDLMRTTRVHFRWNLLNLLAFGPFAAARVARANQQFAARAKVRAKSWYRQFMLETVIVWAVKIALVCLSWKKALLFVFIPHLYAVWGIVEVNYLWHDGCAEDHPYNHSRNFVGKVFNFFTLNNGYHGIHHMEPSLHWSLAPKAHAELVHPFVDPALEQRSLVAYLVRTFVWPGKRVRYTGEPFEPVDPPDEPFITELGTDEMAELQLA